MGTLTAVQADFGLTAESNGVWSSDLGVFVTNDEVIQTSGDGGTGVAQVGGFNSWGSTQYSAWGSGGDSAIGTPTTGTITLSTPITFNGNAGDPNVFLAHLWNAASTGSWEGTITLVGVNVIPEPSNTGLLTVVFASFALIRRRR